MFPRHVSHPKKDKAQTSCRDSGTKLHQVASDNILGLNQVIKVAILKWWGRKTKGRQITSSNAFVLLCPFLGFSLTISLPLQMMRGKFSLPALGLVQLSPWLQGVLWRLQALWIHAPLQSTLSAFLIRPRPTAPEL